MTLEFYKTCAGLKNELASYQGIQLRSDLKKMAEIQKRKKGQILNNSERQLILNLMHYLKEKNSGISVSEVIREISKATGCSERTIYKIKKEASKGIITAPNKRRLRKKENKNSRNVKYDSYVKSSIREKVHHHFLQNVAPTLNAILCLVNNDPNLPNFKRSTLHTLLKEIGFVYEPKGKKSLLTERCDIVKCRHEYLNNIRRFRSENRWIVYTGETVISLMGKEIVKDDDTIPPPQENALIDSALVNSTLNCDEVNAVLMNDPEIVAGATLVYTIDACGFENNLSDNTFTLNPPVTSSIQNFSNCADNVPVHTVLTDDSYLFGENSKIGGEETESVSNESEINQGNVSRELRFTVMHAGSEAGFLEGVEHTVLTKKKTEEIDNYEKWFINKLLPRIPANSVIVVDNNAPYHKKKEENIPDATWKKQKIKNWLSNKNVNVTDINQKKDLLNLVNDLKSIYSTRQKINELATQKGITLVTLPPHHYELNPLNMVWGQVKCHVRSNMKSFKIKRIKQLVKEAFYSVTDINWMNYVHHIKQMEDLLWTLDELNGSNQAKSS